MELINRVQRRVMKLEGVENENYEEWLREVGLCSLENGRLGGNLSAPYNYLEGVGRRLQQEECWSLCSGDKQ